MVNQRILIAAEDCEVANRYFKDLYNDPMTAAMGAPTDDISRGFLERHTKTCKKCQDASNEANMP